MRLSLALRLRRRPTERRGAAAVAEAAVVMGPLRRLPARGPGLVFGLVLALSWLRGKRAQGEERALAARHGGGVFGMGGQSSFSPLGRRAERGLPGALRGKVGLKKEMGLGVAKAARFLGGLAGLWGEKVRERLCCMNSLRW